MKNDKIDSKKSGSFGIMLAMAAVLVVIKTPPVSIVAMNLVFFLVAAATFFYSRFFKNKAEKGRFFASVPFVTLVCALFMVVLNIQLARVQIGAAPIMAFDINGPMEDFFINCFWIKVLLSVCSVCLGAFILWYCENCKSKTLENLRLVLDGKSTKESALDEKSNEAVDFASVVDAASRFICGAARAIVFIQLCAIIVSLILSVKNGKSDVMSFIGLHLVLTAASGIVFSGTFVFLLKALENLFFSNK